MAFKYSRSEKFDDQTKAVSQAVKKVNEAFWTQAQRRALEASLNRILWGVIGTNSTAATAIEASFKSGCQTGGTGGLGVAKPLGLLINGRAGTTATAGSFDIPDGTQSSNTFVKYGIFIGFGTSGTVLAGNEGATATAAYLPDCPSGYVCVGYMQYATTAGTAWDRSSNVVTGQSGACGTATFVDLIHMPLYEA